MTLNESIVEDAALILPVAILIPAFCLRPSPLRSGSQREKVKRLNPAIAEEARSTIRLFRGVRNSTRRESNP